MARSFRDSAYAVIVPVGFAVTAGLFILTIVLQPRKPDTTAWAEHRLLLVDRSAEVSRVQQALEETGLAGVVSWAVQQVHVSLFDAVERVAIAQLPQRLERLDPRYDPYMERLGTYFAAQMDGDEWHVLYLPAAGHPLRSWTSLRSALAPLGYRWHLLSFAPWHAVLVGVCFALVAALVVWKLGGWVYGAAGLFWLPNLASGSMEVYVGVAAAFLATVLLLREVDTYLINRFVYGWRRRDPRVLELRSLYLAGTLCLAVTFPLLVGAPAAFPLLFSFLGSVAWFATQAAHRIIRARHVEHVPFMPVPIQRMADRPTPAVLNGPILRVSLLVLFVVPLVLIGVTETMRTEVVPRPALESSAGELSWRSLQRLWRLSVRDPMPNLSDYLAHRAYQDGISYGRPYGFPELGEQIELSEYRYLDEGIEQSYRVVFSYTRDWYDRMLHEARNLGIESVLVLQGQASPVMLDRVQSLPDALASVLASCLFGLLALSPLAIVPRRGQARIVHRMRGTSFRRKKQAA